MKFNTAVHSSCVYLQSAQSSVLGGGGGDNSEEKVCFNRTSDAETISFYHLYNGRKGQKRKGGVEECEEEWSGLKQAWNRGRNGGKNSST